MSFWKFRRSTSAFLPMLASSPHARRSRLGGLALRGCEPLEVRRLLTAGAAPSAIVASSVPVETQSLAVNGSLVAAFVNDASDAPASSYTASIDWGDGSSPS